MQKLNKLSLFALILSLYSCSGNETQGDAKEKVVEEEIIVVKDSIEEVAETDLLSAVEKPKNVVTQEFWDQFDTDINGIVYFSKKDSTFENHGFTLSSIQEKADGVTLYKFYTNDNYAQLYLNDSLAFDMTPFLLEYEEGFVLLKPHFIPTFVSSDEDEKRLIDEIVTFFNQD